MPDPIIVSDDGKTEEESVEGNVSVETYKRVLKQRKADREKAKALEEENNALKAERETAENAKLAEANEYKKLYETEKKKREETESKLSEMSNKQVTDAKTKALSEALGGLKKSEYLKFADLSQIQMNDDGTVEGDSLATVVTVFRTNYPELVPIKGKDTLPNMAPKGYIPPPVKPLSEMTQEELRNVYKNVRAK